MRQTEASSSALLLFESSLLSLTSGWGMSRRRGFTEGLPGMRASVNCTWMSRSSSRSWLVDEVDSWCLRRAERARLSRAGSTVPAGVACDWAPMVDVLGCIEAAAEGKCMVKP